MLKKTRGVIDDDEGSRGGREVERGRGEKENVIRDEGRRGVERGTWGREGYEPGPILCVYKQDLERRRGEEEEEK